MHCWCCVDQPARDGGQSMRCLGKPITGSGVLQPRPGSQSAPLQPHFQRPSFFGRRQKFRRDERRTRFSSLQRAASSNPSLLFDVAWAGACFAGSLADWFLNYLLFLSPCCSRFAPDTTTNGSFIASVARRLPASHSHLTGEVDGGVNWEDLDYFTVSSNEHGVRI